MKQRPLIIKTSSDEFVELYNKDTISAFFYMNPNIKTVDIIQWGNTITKWTNFSYLINGNSIKTITATDAPILKNVISMFHNCYDLESINNIENWDLSNITATFFTFYNCHNFNSDISDWNVSNIKDMRYMFYNCYKFNSNLSKWDVSNLIDAYHAFYNCHSFEHDLSNWNIPNVKYTNSIFENCKNPNTELLRILKLRDL